MHSRLGSRKLHLSKSTEHQLEGNLVPTHGVSAVPTNILNIKIVTVEWFYLNLGMFSLVKTGSCSVKRNIIKHMMSNQNIETRWFDTVCTARHELSQCRLSLKNIRGNNCRHSLLLPGLGWGPPGKNLVSSCRIIFWGCSCPGCWALAACSRYTAWSPVVVVVQRSNAFSLASTRYMVDMKKSVECPGWFRTFDLRNAAR